MLAYALPHARGLPEPFPSPSNPTRRQNHLQTYLASGQRSPALKLVLPSPSLFRNCQASACPSAYVVVSRQAWIRLCESL